MDKDNLLKVSESLVDFLSIIQNNIMKMPDIPKALEMAKNSQNDCCSDLSIPPSHMRVIFYLIHYNSSPISQIADSLGISKPNMTPIIDNLINCGLVNRYNDPNDRRILRIELTKKANDLLDAFRVTFCNLFKEKISTLSDDDIITLDNSMTNLITIFKKLN